MFFAYIGFDVVATAAEETRNPRRDLPIGIIASLVDLHDPLRRGLAGVVGMQPYQQLSESAPLADAFKAVGLTWAATLIGIGALAGLTTVVMILMLGMSRVMFAMSRDNLLPAGWPRFTRRTARRT